MANYLSQRKNVINKIGSQLLPSRCILKNMKSCPFLHVIFTETLKVVVNFGGNVFDEKPVFIENAYVLYTHWNCLNNTIPI